MTIELVETTIRQFFETQWQLFYGKIPIIWPNDGRMPRETTFVMYDYHQVATKRASIGAGRNNKIRNTGLIALRLFEDYGRLGLDTANYQTNLHNIFLGNDIVTENPRIRVNVEDISYDKLGNVDNAKKYVTNVFINVQFDLYLE